MQSADLTLQERNTELERELELVRRERDNLQLTLQSVHDAIIVVDNTLRIESWNAGAERLYGWRAEEVLGHLLNTFLVTRFSRPTTSAQELNAVLTTGFWEGLVIQAHRDGHDLYIESAVRVVRDQQGEFRQLVAVNRDASEWARVPLEGVFEQIPAGFALYDTSSDFRCIRHNARFLQLVGSDWRERGSIVGVPLRDLFDAASAEATAEIFANVLATGEIFAIDEYAAVLLPEPEPRYYQWSLIPIRDPWGLTTALLVSAHEVTQYKRAQEALRLRDRAIAAASSGILITGTQQDDYAIIYCNPAFTQLTGYSEAEVMGRNCRFLRGPDTDPLTIGTIRQALQAEQPCQVVILNYRKDGSPFWNELTIAPVRDANDQLIHFIGVQNDVTARENSAAERLLLERQLQETQKLESLGVLAGGIAHDFNNLLVAILGNAELALFDLAPEAPARTTVEQIRRAAHRAADLTRQLLAYAGKGRFVVQRLNLNAIVEEMVHLLHASVPKNVVVRYNLAVQLPTVEADATQLRQIVMNLVVNAAEAIGEKSGVVLITSGLIWADQTYLKESLHLADIPEGTYVYLEISDTGQGMDGPTQARIFEPFFTTKTTGRGLGLSAVLGIVRSHRGALRVYSEPGKGSSFKLLLPAVVAAADVLPPVTHVDPAWKGQGTILVIDDEAEIRAVTSRMLERLGFGVLAAEDGVSGLKTFYDHLDEIRCVLMDLTMPHLGGTEVFSRLRNKGYQVPIILMSGYNEQDAIPAFAGKGLAGFLQKPFTPAELQRLLQQVIQIEQ
jgi:PAS domain S-box-containing protein